MKRIASVAVMAGDRLLIGKRSDDHRWNLPGGHVDEGETPEQGAARELLEETGISVDPERLLSLREPQKVTTFTGKEIEVHSYLVVLPDTCDTKREGTDPGEAHDWSWTNVENGLPAEVAQMWHNKTDATLEALGLQTATNDAMHKAKFISPDKQKANRAKAHDGSYPAYEGEPDGPRIHPVSSHGMHEVTDHKVHAEYAKEYSKDFKPHVGEAHAALADHFSGSKPLDAMSLKRHQNTIKTHYDSLYKSEEEEPLHKAWPRHYNRVKGQTSDKGVASKKQYRYMQAMAGQGDADAKAYLKHSPKGGEGLSEEGKGRESDKRKKHKEKDKAEKGEKKLDTYDEHREAENIKRANRPKVVTFGQEVQNIKAKYGEKKPKSFSQEVTDIKARYKKPMEKSSDLFYAKIEGLLTKGFQNQELISHLMDAELLARSSEDLAGHESLMKSVERLFDAAMSKEEQTVYELSYMAKCGCEESLEALEKFTVEMYEELIKHTPIEDAVAEMVKSNYGPKNMGLYSEKDNVGRKMRRVGDVYENIGQNKAAQKYTPAVAGTMAEQTAREAKEIQRKNKKQPVKVLSDEEKAAYQAKLKEKDPDRKIASEMLEDDEVFDIEKSADNSKVKGKVNGHSYRMVHGYKRYTSGPKRGEYVHRHEAEKRIGRKLGSKEHVDHKDGNRAGTKNTKVMSASAHAAKTNKTRAGKGYSGGKRYEHTRD